MRIIHVITAFGIGGAEKLLLNVINKQVEENEVHLIYFKDKNNLVSDLDKRVIVKQIPLSFRITKKLETYYKKSNPDIIHTHLGHADIFGIWSARNIKAKVFCTMHNIYFKKGFIDSIIFKIYTFLFLKIVKNSIVISISKSVENHVIKKLKVPKKRSFLLLNAIPSKKTVKLIKSVSKVNLLFVGRLEKQKSLPTLLNAIALLNTKSLKKEFHLRIVGDGSLKKDLEKLKHELKIKKLVSFEGETKNVDLYYETSDIFILPSIWEGFGIVILEAFRASLAVIATNLEGPSELIKNNQNGLLFEPTNHVQLSKKIEELINDEAKRNALAKKGYSTFTEKYHIDTYTSKLNTLYENAHTF
jgi:glycosyltransferase involved in cell wall biosynthesis